MKRATALGFRSTAFAIAGIIVGLSAISPLPAEAQVPGNNAVYSSNAIVPSSAFIDASVFIGNGPNQRGNICDAIYGILSGTLSYQYPATGAVIDARGISGSPALTCPAGTMLWNGTAVPPAFVLLPAGTIIINSTWVLPSNTHLIGEGDGIPSSSTPATTIQAGSSFPDSMIEFGSSSTCPSVGSIAVCTGISVENLTLDGLGHSMNGITNGFSQNTSYVNHVTLYRIHGVGLLLEGTTSGGANNSGPYSNITCDVGFTPPSTAACAQIFNPNGGTHGIHGLTCTLEGTGTSPSPAILLDSSNNSIENVSIKGFTDGIRIGKNGNAQSNVLVNINGNTVSGENVVHIFSTLGKTITDLSIMGVSNVGGGTTIQDDLTVTSLQDPSVALYALGEKSNGGYSRFTTSPNAATWGSGTSAPGSCSSSASGSLYSNSAGGANGVFFVCPAGGGLWKPIL
jgi:hypothetical protein